MMFLEGLTTKIKGEFNMRQVKKAAVLTLLIALFATVLAACGGGGGAAETRGSSSGGNPGSDSVPEPVTLRFSWWGSDVRHKSTLDAIDIYMKANPHVTIEAEYGGWDGYEQKIKTQLAGGTAPDILQLDSPWLAELSQGSLLLDIGAESGLDLAQFDPTFLEDFMTFDDRIVGLPMGVNGRTILVNQSLADELGVRIEEQLTWDGLVELAKQVRAIDPNYYLLNSDSGITQMVFASLIRQMTGAPIVKDDNTLSFTKEQAQRAFEWIVAAYEAGVYEPYGDAQLFFGKMDQNPKWINQQFLGIDAWSSEITKYAGALPEGTVTRSIHPPKFEDARTGSAIVRPSQVVSINQKTPNKEEALRFLNWFLTDPEAAGALGDSRAVPAVDAAREAIVNAQKMDPNVSLAVELATQNQAVPDNAMSQNSQINEVVNSVIEKVAFGVISPEAAADELMKGLTDKIAAIAK